MLRFDELAASTEPAPDVAARRRRPGADRLHQRHRVAAEGRDADARRGAVAVRELHRRRRRSRATTWRCTRCRCTTARSSTCFSGPSLYVGATNVITAKPTPDNLLPLIERHRITLVLRAADGVDLAAALAAVRRDRPLVAEQGLLRRVDHAGGGAARDCRAAAERAAVEPVRPDRDRAAGDDARPRRAAAQARLVRPRGAQRGDARGRRRDARRAARRGRRDRAPLAATAAGLLPRRRAHAGRVRGRLVPLRRPGDDRRRGLHHGGRPQEGHDQDRRRERRQPRGGRGDLPPGGRVARWR